jgi:hypothetical protein
MMEFSAITGFPYEDPEGTLPYMYGNIYYQVFDTIQFKRNPDRHHVMENYFTSNPLQVTTQNARMPLDKQDAFEDEEYRNTGRILNEDMDLMFMNKHFNRQGVGNEASNVVIPTVTHYEVWELRDQLECYEKAEYIKGEYPFAFVDAIKKECEDRKRLTKEAERGNVLFSPATDDLIDKKRRKTDFDPNGQLADQLENTSLNQSRPNLEEYAMVEASERITSAQRLIQKALQKNRTWQTQNQESSRTHQASRRKNYDHMEEE